MPTTIWDAVRREPESRRSQQALRGAARRRPARSRHPAGANVRIRRYERGRQDHDQANRHGPARPGRRIEVFWDGRPGYMPEQRGHYPQMPIGDQLSELAELRGTPTRVAERATDDHRGAPQRGGVGRSLGSRAAYNPLRQRLRRSYGLAGRGSWTSSPPATGSSYERASTRPWAGCSGPPTNRPSPAVGRSPSSRCVRSSPATPRPTDAGRSRSPAMWSRSVWSRRSSPRRARRYEWHAASRPGGRSVWRSARWSPASPSWWSLAAGSTRCGTSDGQQGVARRGLAWWPSGCPTAPPELDAAKKVPTTAPRSSRAFPVAIAAPLSLRSCSTTWPASALRS